MGIIIILLSTMVIASITFYIEHQELKKSKRLKRREKNILKLVVFIFTLILSLAAYIDSISSNKTEKTLMDGQESILYNIELTEKKKDSIRDFYFSKMDLKDEELRIAKNKIEQLLNEMKYYNDSDDLVVKSAYKLFLELKFDEAINLLDEYILKKREKDLLEVYELKIKLHFSNGEYDKAINYTKKVVEIDPSPVNLYNVALSLYQLGYYSHALEYFEKLIQEIGDNSETITLYDLYITHYYYAILNSRIEKYNLALDELKKSEVYLNKLKNNYSIFYEQINIKQIKAVVFTEKKEINKARKEFLEIISLLESKAVTDPSARSILVSLTYSNLSSLENRMFNPELALEYNDKGIDAIMSVDMKDVIKSYNETYIQLLINRGVILSNLDKDNEAIETFQLVIDVALIMQKYDYRNYLYFDALANMKIGQLFFYQNLKKKSKERFILSLQKFEELDKEEERLYQHEISAIKDKLRIL